MSLISIVKWKIHRLLQEDKDPRKGYDLWASQYDNEQDNLMLLLEQRIFTDLISDLDINNKVIIDVGCGTGRHWKELFDKKAKEVIGYDVSEKMLDVLRTKFIDASAFVTLDDHLSSSSDNSCDLLISTLAFAHIKDIPNAMREWNRVLKAGAEILITDYHPKALALGADRTFLHNGKTISIKNYVHNIDQIMAIAKEYKLTVLAFKERLIDESVRSFYERKKALKIYEKFRGIPIVYGMLLKKAYDIS